MLTHLTPAGQEGDRIYLTATAVELAGRGAVFLGASGSGKSGLALQMLALGARLISDDAVWLDAGNRLIRPAAAPPMIEARGIGLLRAEPCPSAPLCLAVDLDRHEPDRLPPWRQIAAPGGPVPLILGRDHPCLAAALCQYLRQGRAE